MQHNDEMSRKNNSQEQNVRLATLREPDPATVEKAVIALLPASARLLELVVPGDVAGALVRMIERGDVATRPDPVTGRTVVVDRRRGERQGVSTPRSDKQKAQLSILFAGGR